MKLHKALVHYVRFLRVFIWLFMLAAGLTAIRYLWSGQSGVGMLLSLPLEAKRTAAEHS